METVSKRARIEAVGKENSKLEGDIVIYHKVVFGVVRLLRRLHLLAFYLRSMLQAFAWRFDTNPQEDYTKRHFVGRICFFFGADFF